MTLVSSVDDGLIPSVGGGPDLSFVLLGSTAVPEPSTWAMLLMGFLGFGVMARRRVVLVGARAG